MNSRRWIEVERLDPKPLACGKKLARVAASASERLKPGTAGVSPNVTKI
jgi:hypothetical protein